MKASAANERLAWTRRQDFQSRCWTNLNFIFFNFSKHCGRYRRTRLPSTPIISSLRTSASEETVFRRQWVNFTKHGLKQRRWCGGNVQEVKQFASEPATTESLVVICWQWNQKNRSVSVYAWRRARVTSAAPITSVAEWKRIAAAQRTLSACLNEKLYRDFRAKLYVTDRPAGCRPKSSNYSKLSRNDPWPDNFSQTTFCFGIKFENCLLSRTPYSPLGRTWFGLFFRLPDSFLPKIQNFEILFKWLAFG